MFLSCLVPLCSWIYSVLFCMQGFATPMSYSIVLRDTDRTCLSKNHFRSALLSTSAISLLYLRYKLAKVHIIITSLIYHLETGLCHNKPLHHALQGGWQSTCLGFVRGCLRLGFIGSWFCDSWNRLSFHHTQKGSSLLFLGGKHLGLSCSRHCHSIFS